MFSVKSLFFLLALLVAVASALPLNGHKRRSSCPHNNHASAVAASASAASSAAAHPSAIDAAVHTSTAHSSAASSAPVSSAVHSTSKAGSATSSAAPSSSTGKLNPGGGSAGSGSLLAHLFPVGNVLKTWSTASGATAPVDLSDATFRPVDNMSQLAHNYVTIEGKKALQAHYVQGSFQLSHAPYGGLSFYAPGPADVDLTIAKEATLGYSVLFEDGFEFNLGGKLPGLYGGDSASGSISCSGGSRNNACFSARLMWRPEGAGELYTYLPPKFSENNRVCNVAPQSDCNPTYGASVGRGSFHFAPGQWTTVSQRVRLNDAGEANGELELFVGGKSVVNVGGLVLRQGDAGRIRGIQMQTFFGGSTAQWASPKAQNAYFSDFSVAITEKL